MKIRRSLAIYGIGISLVSAATAEEDYAISESQFGLFYEHNLGSGWSIPRPPAICMTEICAEPAPPWGNNVISERRTGEGCGQEAYNCLVFSQKVGVEKQYSEDIKLIYVRPFSSIFEPYMWNKIAADPSNIVEIYWRSKLVPVAHTTGNAFRETIEAQVASRADRTFINLSLDDGSNARALCEVNSAEDNFDVPYNCIIIEMQNSEESFVLAPVESDLLINATFESGVTLESGETTEVGGLFKINVRDGGVLFFEKILHELNVGSLRIDLDKLDLVVADSRVVILGQAGPRVSAIDFRLREKIDLWISGDRSVSLHLLDEDEPQLETVEFSARVAAWVGRQNVDPTGQWTWPDIQYYQRVYSEISNALLRAFDATCKKISPNTAGLYRPPTRGRYGYNYCGVP